MQAVDFSRSFITWRIDTLKKPPRTVTHALPYTVNNARVQIECVCRIEEPGTGDAQEFFIGASCKTEVVSVPSGIWTQPNADFIPLVTADRFLGIKTYDHADRRMLLHPPELGYQPEKQIVRVDEAFDWQTIHVQREEGSLLVGAIEVAKAVLEHRPIVARTVLTSERYRAELEFPVKTMNVSERERFYQTDTGPVLFPDLGREPADLMSGLELAFVAINRPTHAEFLVRVKTPLDHGMQVWHYSKPVLLEAESELIAL